MCVISIAAVLILVSQRPLLRGGACLRNYRHYPAEHPRDSDSFEQQTTLLLYSSAFIPHIQQQETMLTASLLPPVESPQFQESGLGEQVNAISVYTKILNAEAQAIHDGENENLVSARVVGFLVLELGARHHILGSQACSKVIQEVISLSQDPNCDENDAVFVVGKRHLDHLIRGCTFYYFPVLSLTSQLFKVRTLTQPYRPPSHRPSPPFYDKLEDMIRASLESSGKDYETARKKVHISHTLCLLRSAAHT